ncbi:hypothetical protein [Pantoea sp. CFSAN033090]|uniref:hypothetical protein n=1 Tax=Pantoea sp. CFSAN033090 TaxID=1690502 RepID=UPI00068C9CAC|nr:hypothetical protein [Pantoea sp. CFSAN033090]KOA68702.1 hypothetical protein AFL22_19850 [Pantoea sp. CFSAN033090]
MNHLTSASFFNLDWFIFKIEHCSPVFNYNQLQEGDIATGYIWFQVRGEVTEDDEEELKMHCCFPWFACVMKENDEFYIEVKTEFDDCWLLCHQLVFPSDDKPEYDEFLSYFNSLHWREAVSKSLINS